MTEEEIRETLEEARRQFGLTDEDPDLVVDCPGCGHPVRVWDESDLPMGYECFDCAANYEVQDADHVVLVEQW